MKGYKMKNKTNELENIIIGLFDEIQALKDNYSLDLSYTNIKEYKNKFNKVKDNK